MSETNTVQAVARALLEYITTVVWGWAGIVLVGIGLLGLAERIVDRQGRFTTSTRNKVILALLVLSAAQFLAYKGKHDEVVRFTSRNGLIPLFEEGQKMWPDCLTIADSKIEEWSRRVEAHLRNRRDDVRAARFTDDSGIPPNFPEAAGKGGYTMEQALRCQRVHARLFRLNEFLRELR
jgi:hypothetical protein